MSLLQGLTPEGFQAEMPDIWLQNGNPWEIKRAGIQYRVGFYGTVDQHKWTPGEEVSSCVGCLTQGKALGPGVATAAAPVRLVVAGCCCQALLQ